MPLARCLGAETRLLRAAAQIGAPGNSQNAPRRYLRELVASRSAALAQVRAFPSPSRSTRLSVLVIRFGSR